MVIVIYTRAMKVAVSALGCALVTIVVAVAGILGLVPETGWLAWVGLVPLAAWGVWATAIARQARKTTVGHV